MVGEVVYLKKKNSTLRLLSDLAQPCGKTVGRNYMILVLLQRFCMKIKLTISQKQSTIHQLLPIGSNTILVEPPLRDCSQQQLLLTSPIEVGFTLPIAAFIPPNFRQKNSGASNCVLTLG